MNPAAQAFGGIARLYGEKGLARLQAAHVLIVGLGGVGSWAAEAVARTGVGRLTLIDLDDVCLTNVNRQLQAFPATVGRAKVSLIAERLAAINPACQVEAVPAFLQPDNARALLAARPDVVIDAIDSVRNKCLLAALCRELALPVVASGAAGGRRDPTRIRRGDLATATHDRLLSEMRRRLRQEHGFPPAPALFSVECIYSTEPPVLPGRDSPDCEGGQGTDPAERPARAPTRLQCEWGFGSATFVTGAFGFAAAAVAVDRITRPNRRRAGQAGWTAGAGKS